MSKSFKDQSRLNWQRSDDVQLTNEQIQIGCLQRIADATEAMAKPFVRMTEDLAWYKQERTRLLNENEHLRNRIAGHKAAFTKLKNKIETQEQDERTA